MIHAHVNSQSINWGKEDNRICFACQHVLLRPPNTLGSALMAGSTRSPMTRWLAVRLKTTVRLGDRDSTWPALMTGTSSHASLSTQVCLQRSIILDQLQFLIPPQDDFSYQVNIAAIRGDGKWESCTSNIST